ncbi:MAG TPA: hypothetical protein VF678_14650 [bacterium]
MTMQSIFQWLHGRPSLLASTWLILGKGPTFADRHRYRMEDYVTVGLNHVCRNQKVNVAWMMDLDVVTHLGEALLSNCDVLLMPYYPHLKPAGGGTIRASEASLDQIADGHPVLGRLRAEGRLLAFDFVSSPVRWGAGPVIPPGVFSGDVSLWVLATAGVKRFRTLGLDGGTTYAGAFDDLNSVTLLKNTQPSFDPQFDRIAHGILTFGLDYAPLGVDAPVHVYVGCEPAQDLAFKVLEYSIRRHATVTTAVHPLHEAIRESGIRIPAPKDARNRPRTPFSFHRFAIPKLRDYRGRAIYVDSDMLVFSDIRELWQWPMDGADVISAQAPEGSGHAPQFSVMLVDCEQAAWDLDRIVAGLDARQYTYEDLMFRLCIANKVSAALPARWNHLETFQRGHTSLLHYTDMNRQPWLSAFNPRRTLWERALAQALADGFIERGFLHREVEQGNVRPTLLLAMGDLAKPRPWSVGNLLRRELRFIPPHLREGGAVRRGARQTLAAAASCVSALLRYFWLPHGSARRKAVWAMRQALRGLA